MDLGREVVRATSPLLREQRGCTKLDPLQGQQEILQRGPVLGPDAGTLEADPLWRTVLLMGLVAVADRELHAHVSTRKDR